MRSTLTILDQTDQKLRKLAEREHLSYSQVINLALAKGLERLEAAEQTPSYRVRPFQAGLQNGIDPDHLNQLADDPELPHDYS